MALTNENIILSEKLKKKRKMLGLTQRSAARKSGMNYSTYVQAEIYGKMGHRAKIKVLQWITREN